MIIDEIKQLLSYNVETGVFTWAKQRSKCRAGSVAGGVIDKRGYMRVELLGKNYRLHRLAWEYVYGTPPDGEIDHINGDKQDNRIANLRIVSRAENMQNKRKPRADNKLNLLGVSMNGNGFRSDIGVNKTRVYLGTFKTAELAHEAYINAKRVMHKSCTI